MKEGPARKSASESVEIGPLVRTAEVNLHLLRHLIKWNDLCEYEDARVI